MNIFIIFGISVILGILLFIALKINSISRNLFRISQILDKHENEKINVELKGYIEEA